MTSDYLTREEVLDQIELVSGDLAAFRNAMNAISERKLELSDNPDRQKMFLEWPATQAILNVLIMAITRCEGLLEDHQQLLETMDVPDNVVSLEKKNAD